MKKTELARIVVQRLEEIYPSAECALEYKGDPWRLLVMGRLSAQCTDARVNEVCKTLFVKYPTAADMAQADIKELEEAVKPCGLFRVKAQNLKDASAMLINDFGGALPDTMEELLLFPGVGRKIANLLLGDIFKKPAVVADTHCIRIAGRLGFYPESKKDPLQTERILSSVVDPEKQSDLCHRIVWFGREVCTARSPQCTSCPLADICKHNKDAQKRK